MPLIKSSTNGPDMQSAVVLHLGDLRREAERLEADAIARANRIVDEAKQERERLIADADALGHTSGQERGYAEGFEKGRSEGHAEAVQQAQQDAKTMLEAWQQALDGFEQARENMLHDARADMLRLAALVAEKVTRRVVELDQALVTRQLEGALELVQRPTRLIICIHPDDRASAEEVLPTLLQRLHHATHAQLHDDPALARGSVFIRTEHGIIDASIDTQIARLVEALLPQRHLATPPDSDTDSAPTQ
ncbi:MAG: hypothetical protein EA380_06410 [Phycisphaeraceae bacterium]|nr:MAG: hypothetical protein EA380_06410 [Phycisphaeraceae bacterium]